MVKTVTKARRKIIFGLAAVLVVVATSWLVGSRRSVAEFEARWESVKIGMSKADVEALLGTPQNVYPVQAVQSDSDLGTVVMGIIFESYVERWAYGRRRSLTLLREFPFVCPALDGFMMPEDEDYVLYFSPTGEVIKKVHPYHSKKSGSP